VLRKLLATKSQWRQAVYNSPQKRAKLLQKKVGQKKLRHVIEIIVAITEEK
jgi:hypothetical protein